MSREEHYRKIAIIKKYVLETFEITIEQLLKPDYETIKPILSYVFLINENHREIPDDVLFRNVKIGRKYFNIFYFMTIKLAEVDQEFSDSLVRYNQQLRVIIEANSIKSIFNEAA